MECVKKTKIENLNIIPANAELSGLESEIANDPQKAFLLKKSKWKTISKTKTHKIMLLPEYTIDGYENKKIIENNHFIIQPLFYNLYL